MKILIGGDIAPTQNNIQAFQTGNINELFDPFFLKTLHGCDMRIFNLEAPLTNSPERIRKSGPHIFALLNTVAGLKALNPSLVTIANNHILDCGESGIKNTMNILNDFNIPYVGAGMTLTEAAKPYILKTDNIKIGIYSCCEHEFSVNDNGASANPIDLLESFDHVHSLKEECDYVVVLYHGGKECYRYPTVMQQKICRKFTDKGADLVVCQHSHCVGSYEIYNNATIVYGQGNFLFDQNTNEFWNSGIVIVAEINEDKQATVEFVPVIRCSGPYTCSVEEGKSVLAGFFERSEQIKDNNIIAELQKREAIKSAMFYFCTINGSSPIKRKLLKLLLRFGRNPFYNKKKNLPLLNIIRCETHREMIIEYLSLPQLTSTKVGEHHE